jgi:hypothetical protein
MAALLVTLQIAHGRNKDNDVIRHSLDRRNDCRRSGHWDTIQPNIGRRDDRRDDCGRCPGVKDAKIKESRSRTLARRT